MFVKFTSRARGAKPAAVVEALAKLGERRRDGFTVVRGECAWGADRRAREIASRRA